MKIVFLDTYTMHLEELDYTDLAQIGDLVLFERTSPEQVIERCEDAEVVLTNKVKIDGEIMAALPKLKYIGVTATGYNIIDIDAAKKNNITVTNVSNYSSLSVAQHVFALLLSFTNRVAEHNDFQKWADCPDFSYYDFTLMELAGKTMGLVGIGDIGEQVAKIATAMGMNVLVNRASEKPHDLYEVVSLEKLYEKSDVISLHCPLTKENEGFMNEAAFKQMKKTAILINTARGPLIKEVALSEALKTGEIAGAGLDVLSVEPPKKDSPLKGIKNLIITPHIAWASLEARKRLMKDVATNITSWQHNAPQNVIS